jgi:hypothetical protein
VSGTPHPKKFSPAAPIVSRDSTTVAVLAALGRHGVLMQPRGIALVQSAGNANPSPVQNKTPAEVVW